MADPASEKSNHHVNDPAAVVSTTNHDEPLDSDLDVSDSERDFVRTGKKADDADLQDDIEAGSGSRKGKQSLARAKSYATTTSATSRIEEEQVVVKKAWYKKTNPLKWGAPPPVPETSGVSREYTAGFVSKLYFQWMAPIMSVSGRESSVHSISIHRECANKMMYCRRDINVPSIAKTSGPSTQIAPQWSSQPNSKPHSKSA